MAKDNRAILGSVRIGNQVFTTDMADEFEKAATPEQIARLTEKGVIAGFGKVKEPEEPKGKKEK